MKLPQFDHQLNIIVGANNLAQSCAQMVERFERNNHA